MHSMVTRLFVLGVFALNAAPALADGAAGPWTNLPVCTAPGGRAGVKIVSNGRGGAIIAWYDERNRATPSKLDVYVQGINGGGVAQWTPDGVPLCTAPEEQYNVVLAQDGDGGAIAAWTDWRDPIGYVFAQRVDRWGRTKWTPNGINVSPSQCGVNPRVEPDGIGGAFVVWEALSGFGREIYAQHLDAGGHLLWGPAGIGICTVPGPHFAPSVVADGAAGVIIAWTDMRQPSARIFAQHVTSGGAPYWNLNGIPLCSVASEQRAGAAVSDGAGGAIVVWRDSRKAGPDTLGLFAQRVDGLGHLLWDGAGVDLCRRPLNDDLFVVACANRGGAIIGWHDRRSGQYDVRAQSVSASGKLLWDGDGAGVCIAPGDQVYPAITSDDAGAAFITWEDYRNSAEAVYVQHVAEDGDVAWGASGVRISKATGDGFPAMTADGRGGAFVAWTDREGDSFNFNVLAERIADSGHEGRRDGGRRRGPRSGRVAVGVLDGDGFSLRLNLLESSNMRTAVYDLAGRRVRNLVAGYLESGEHVVRWNGRDDVGRRVRAGVYFVRVETDEGGQTLRAVLGR